LPQFLIDFYKSIKNCGKCKYFYIKELY